MKGRPRLALNREAAGAGISWLVTGNYWIGPAALAGATTLAGAHYGYVHPDDPTLDV